jgi:signal transduction histidine kinase
MQMAVNATVINNNIPVNMAIFANAAYIESILHNILSNAIKYCHPDRVPIIDISAVEENNTLVLSIKDNGIGIDLKKHHKDLFGMYKTFSNHKDAKGIGLFITKYQVEVMGGEIGIDSELNVGTIFTIKFPVTN